MRIKHVGLLQDDMFLRGDLEPQYTFRRIDRFFKRAIITGILLSIVASFGWVAFTAGKLQRPLKYVYVFVPTNKVKDTIRLYSLNEVKSSEILGLLEGVK